MVPITVAVLALMASSEAPFWNPTSLHLFVDMEGLASAANLTLVQHRPRIEGEVVVHPDRAWDGAGGGGYIHPYVSTVQVSPVELRIYYFGEGSGVRCLCVAVSHDSGKTWIKPSLGLVAINGNTKNNIIAAGSPLGFLGSPDIAAGTVFIDENPAALPHEKFKMVMHWKNGAAMFASADGYEFVNMTAQPALIGSDTQDVVFWDARVGQAGAYVYYGRSHMLGGQSETCSESLAGMPPAPQPERSINHFAIGSDLTKWPYSQADDNQTAIVCLNTDDKDPPCLDLYTSSATPLGDATLFFPMMYNHFDSVYAQGRGNDGTLEARLAVSRPGGKASYISREAFYPRGEGRPRVGNTGVYEGAFDAAATAIAQGLFQVGEETWLVGMGRQYTHAGYGGLPQPPCRGRGPGPCVANSGLQLLKLRRNGFVSLSTSAQNAAQSGVITTQPFKLPMQRGNGMPLVLQLNLVSAIGRGAICELRDPMGKLLGVSERIIDGGVDFNVSWSKPPTGGQVRRWVPDGCKFLHHLHLLTTRAVFVACH